MIIKELASVIIAYLLGSIPFAYIFARVIKGIDIRQVGTHNVGTMNTWKEVGLFPALAVLILDIGKGSLSILIAQWLDARQIFVFLAGLAVIAGHTWPVFLSFRGGKGAATSVGVLFALAPQIFAISFSIIVILVVITRDTGFGLGIGLILFLLLLGIFGEDINLILYSLAIPVFLLIINFPDLRRDISGNQGWKNWLITRRVAKWRFRKRQEKDQNG
jgi:acyl phosphate:glycerol-3-phosphate acyltransferase